MKSIVFKSKTFKILKRMFKGCSKERIQWTLVFIILYVLFGFLGMPFLFGYPIDHNNLFHMFAFCISIMVQAVFWIVTIILLLMKFVKGAVDALHDGETE